MGPKCEGFQCPDPNLDHDSDPVYDYTTEVGTKWRMHSNCARRYSHAHDAKMFSNGDLVFDKGIPVYKDSLETHKKIQDPHLVVQSLIHLRDEMADKAGLVASWSVVQKINSCLYHTHPEKKDG